MPNEHLKFTPPEVVLELLLSDPSGLTREWLIDGRISLSHIGKMVRFRKEEVFFTERDGKVWINERTDTASKVIEMRSIYEQLFKREEEGKLNAHIHPYLDARSPNPSLYTDFLSWADILAFLFHNNTHSRYVLFHPKGGLEFQAPVLPPELSAYKNFTLGMGELLNLFSKRVGVNCTYKGKPGDIQGISQTLDTVGVRVSRELAEQFAREHGMIVREASWTDLDAMQELVDIVNLEPK